MRACAPGACTLDKLCNATKAEGHAACTACLAKLEICVTEGAQGKPERLVRHPARTAAAAGRLQANPTRPTPTAAAAVRPRSEGMALREARADARLPARTDGPLQRASRAEDRLGL